ncbi:MAG: TIR domain-containing protein [Alphaproteobacteria bacterium]|nr:MAG: TIR domain-containing protein [Alphaproteobacteria bacterium]
MMAQHQVFVSYARKDDQPAGSVTALVEWLTARHANQPFSVFFDTQSIAADQLWRGRIGQGLRSSRLFLMVLTPNYLASEVCRWEFETYLRFEHGLAHGDDGVRILECSEVPGLLDGPLDRFPDAQRLIVQEVRKRTLTPERRLHLADWPTSGAAMIQALQRQDGSDDLRQLADRLAAFDQALTRRLDQMALVERAPGSVGQGTATFVGRRQEIAGLRRHLTQDRVGVIGTVHGLGGQGKTALVRHYAHAFAGDYAAGGRWELPVEGKTSLADVLAQLVDRVGLQEANLPRRPEAVTAEANTAFVQDLLVQLGRYTHTRAEALTQEGFDVAPQCLLIFDNLDCPELLTATEAASLGDHPWLHIAITTRLDPEHLGSPSLRGATIAIDDLPVDDALDLLQLLRPFPPEMAPAARAIVDHLGGFTLLVELVGTYLQVNRSVSYQDYLTRLQQESLFAVDALPHQTPVAVRIRHREQQLAEILDQTLATLSDYERAVLDTAALFPPDQIIVDWLRRVVMQHHRHLAPDQVRPGYPDPFQAATATLTNRRLLPPSPRLIALKPEVEALSIHRMVAEALRNRWPEETVAGRWGSVMALAEAIGNFLQTQWRAAPQQVAWLVAPFADLAAGVPEVHDPGSCATSLGIVVEPLSRLAQFERATTLAQVVVERFRHLAESLPASKNLQRGLAASLSQLGTLYQRRGAEEDSAAALAACRESFEISRRLAAADPTDVQAARDMSVALGNLGDLYLRRRAEGDSAAALAAYQEALEINRRLAAANPTDGEAARDLSVSLDKLGDFYQRRGAEGDSAVALAAYLESLDVDRRLAAANPNDAGAARDLSVSLSQLGAFYQRRGAAGDSAAALEAYQESLEIARRLANANRTDGQAARDLSVSLTQLGDFYRRRGAEGDSAAALAAYQESLEIARRLAAANPTDGQAARDLSLSLSQLGAFYQRRWAEGDSAAALEANQESLKIARRLAASNPTDGQAARELSVSLTGLGDLYQRRGAEGDSAAALAAYQESLEMFRRLAAVNSTDGQAARDLSLSLEKLGDLYQRRGAEGDSAAALAVYQESLEIRRRLAAANPTDGRAARDLAASLERVAMLGLEDPSGGRSAEALAFLTEALGHRAALANANDGQEQLAREEVLSLNQLGIARQRLGDVAAAREVELRLLTKLSTYRQRFEPHPGMLPILERLDQAIADGFEP